jgi:hypothetical protein
MNDDHVVPFDDPDHHHSVERLLPWFVNGTLAADERLLVEDHLLRCASCSADISAQRGWRDQLQPGPPAAHPDQSFARLRGRLSAPTVPQGRPMAERLRACLGMLRAAAPEIRFALTAQGATILVLMLLIFREAQPLNFYQTRGVAPAARAGTARILVAFDGPATLQEFRSALLATHGRLTDGPTETGVCVFEIPAGSVREALQTLRAGHGVRLAESLEPDSSP